MIWKEDWEGFRNGDHTSTSTLKTMLQELEAAMPFLNAYGDYSVRRCALLDGGEIQVILRARKRKTA